MQIEVLKAPVTNENTFWRVHLSFEKFHLDLEIAESDPFRQHRLGQWGDLFAVIAHAFWSPDLDFQVKKNFSRNKFWVLKFDFLNVLRPIDASKTFVVQKIFFSRHSQILKFLNSQKEVSK